jgi:hypothetical protein
MHVEGSFEVTSWNETAYEEDEGGGKRTAADVTQRFTGGFEGEGSVRWLMAYRRDGTAHFVGVQRMTGTMEGREGSLVISTIGEFDGSEAGGDWTVVDGAGGFEGRRGVGSFRAPHGSQGTWRLDLTDH